MARKHFIPENAAWYDIRRRCLNSASPHWEHYGGRGISICQRWLDNFHNFLADMGPRPSPEYSIDRINNNGHYSCGKCEECIANGWSANCRWATWLQQHRNRRNNHLLTFQGQTCCISEWAEILGLQEQLIHSRLKRGWSVNRALSTKVNKDDPKGTRTSNRNITYNGKTMPIYKWAKEVGLPAMVLYKRITTYKWPVERALTEPLTIRNRNRAVIRK